MHIAGTLDFIRFTIFIMITFLNFLNFLYTFNNIITPFNYIKPNSDFEIIKYFIFSYIIVMNINAFRNMRNTKVLTIKY